MDLEKEDKIKIINSRLKILNGKLSLLGTQEDFGDLEEDVLAKIGALTNALKMI